MDPSGGNPIHGYSPMYDWGVIGIDVGFTLGGRWMGRKLAKGHRRRVWGEYRETMRGVGSQQAKIKARMLFPSQTRAAQAGSIRFGRALWGFGLVAGALALADMGVELGSWMMEPGVAREALEADRRLFTDEAMLDTRAAYTQRQRSIQAIHDSQLSIGRSMVGQEASYLHR
jgi:hypothetical protein